MVNKNYLIIPLLISLAAVNELPTVSADTLAAEESQTLTESQSSSSALEIEMTDTVAPTVTEVTENITTPSSEVTAESNDEVTAETSDAIATVDMFEVTEDVTTPSSEVIAESSDEVAPADTAVVSEDTTPPSDTIAETVQTPEASSVEMTSATMVTTAGAEAPEQFTEPKNESVTILTEAAAEEETTAVTPAALPTALPVASSDVTVTATTASQWIKQINTNQKVLSLTFDDGGDAGNLELILDSLLLNDVKATFFLNGDTDAGLIQRMVAEGHLVGNHTFYHESPIYQTAEDLTTSINLMEDYVRDLTGLELTPYFRAPYGDVNGAVLETVGSLGYDYTFDWTVDPRDWMGIPAEDITYFLTENLLPGAIYLLHANDGAIGTPTALLDIIPAMKAEGYALMTLADLLTYEGKFTSATNVGLDKPVTASQTFTDSQYITDGNALDTEAYADGTETGLQWVQVDLQQVHEVNEIKLWHYYGDQRQYQDVIVQLSTDAGFQTGVITVFNNDGDNTAGLGQGSDSQYFETSAGKVISFNPVLARYVRFYTNGNTVNGYNHYVDIQIMGEPVVTQPVVNVALGKAVTVSQPFTDSQFITDGNALNTDAYADGTGTGLQWVQVDLQQAHDVNEIRLWHYYGDQRQYEDVIVQLSNDASFTTGVTTVFNNDGDNSAGLGTGSDSQYWESSAGKVISFNPVLARYVRFYTNGNTVNDYSHYVDIQIMGEPTTQPAVNVALGKPVTVSQPFTDSQFITDGNALNTDAYADGTGTGLQWVQVDLQAVYDVDEIKLWHYYGDQRQHEDVIVQLSNDASFTTGVTTVFNNDGDNTAGLGSGSDSQYWESSDGKVITVNGVSARYVRFYANGNTVNDYSHYVDIQIIGALPASPEGFVDIPTAYRDEADWEGSLNQAVNSL